MITRRKALGRLSLGASTLALSPFLRNLQREDATGELPRRFVFVVKSSGLQAEYLNPEGLQHGGDRLVDAPLAQRPLHESLRALEPLRDQLTIVQGLSGRMCTIGHSSFYGAMGAYKATAEAPPIAATIDGHLSRRFPSVFDHVGLKMGNGSQGTSYPSISAAGRGKQLPFQCNPELAYRNLFGSIAAGGDIQRMYRRTGNVLDAMVEDIQRLRRQLPGSEQEKLDAYLEGFESLRDRRIELIAMQRTLKEHAPEVTDAYTSKATTQHLGAHFDMAAAALITGITNVVTIHCDELDSSYSGLGITPSVHSIGHGSSSGALSAQECRNRIRAFHLQLTGALASRLAATPEGDGSMLDNTLIVYLSDNSDKHHSSGTEWPLLMLGGLRGRAASGGRYLAYPRYGRASHRHTIGNLWTTVCHLTGEPVEHFGQADLALGDAALQRGPLDELLG